MHPHLRSVTSSTFLSIHKILILSILIFAPTHQSVQATPCEQPQSSNQKDFTAVVSSQNSSTCATPSGLFVTNVGVSVANLHWGFRDSDIAYELQWRPKGDEISWPNSTTTTYSIYFFWGTLSPSTVYEWRVRSLCEDQNNSIFSSINSFTTGNCTVPTATTEGNFTASNVIFYWNGAEGVTNYRIRYREAGLTAWNTLTACCGAGAYTPGFAIGRNYEWQVATQCGPVLSDFTSPRFFSLECPAPFGLKEQASSSIARLEWADQGNLNYIVQWRVKSDSTWNQKEVPDNTLSLTGLSPPQEYEWRVKTSCANETTSSFTLPRSFTTSCKTPSYLSNSIVGSSSTWLYWPAFSDEMYKVQYRIQGETPWTTIESITSSPYNLTGLRNGKTYEYQLQINCPFTQNPIVVRGANFLTSCSYRGGLSYRVRGSYIRLFGISSPGSDHSFDVLYRPIGSTTVSSINSLTTNGPQLGFMLTGLSPATTYDLQIVMNCPNDPNPSRTTWYFFTTLACPKFYTIKPGFWSDPNVWSCNQMPRAEDIVEIRHPIVMTLNMDAAARLINYTDQGKLIWEAGAKLWMGY